MIIVFDGECGMCNRSVQFILRHERNPNLKFAALKSSYAKKILNQFGLSSDYDKSILFYENGKLYSKSKAVLRIIPYLKFYLFPLFVCWLVPNFIRDSLYDSIAKKRNKNAAVCELKTSIHANRFLD